MRHSREDDGKREKRKWCQGPGGFQNGLGKVPCIYMFSDWRGDAGASGHAGIPQAHTSRPYIHTSIPLVHRYNITWAYGGGTGDLTFNTRGPVGIIYFCNNGVSYLQAMPGLFLRFLNNALTYSTIYLSPPHFAFGKQFDKW